MKLGDYLKQGNLTHGEFAGMIGCEQPTVSRFVAGARIPSTELMRRIFDVSGGSVTPNDFFDIPAASLDEATSAEAA